MDRIKFITDTACDIPLDMAQRHDVDLAPLTVTVDGETFRESYDITPQEFYDKCAVCRELPVSAGVNITEYLDRFQAAYEAGYDQVCVVCINSGGSVSYNAALAARDDFYEAEPQARPRMPIEIVDSRTYSIAYGIPVLMASRMHREEGAKLAEILDFFSDWFDRVEIYFAPLTFDFVKRSGRVSGTAAFVGQALGIRPIVSIIEGKTRTAATIRGESRVIDGFLKIFQDRARRGAPYGILVGTVPEMAKEMSLRLRDLCGRAPEGIYQAGPAITINGGPKLLAFCFLAHESRELSQFTELVAARMRYAEEIVEEMVQGVEEKVEKIARRIHDKGDD